jgi:hypothetical protein
VLRSPIDHIGTEQGATMTLSPTKKVLATAGAAVGIVLGAAGITAAATGSSATPASGSGSATTVQQPATDQENVDYTPANEQGKPEVADANEANDPAEANDKADAPDGSDVQDAPGSTPGQAPASTTQG